MAYLVIGCLMLVVGGVLGHPPGPAPAPVPAPSPSPSDPCVIIDDKQKLPQDCADIYDAGVKVSGVYWIKPHQSYDAFMVYCEITKTEGWTVIMFRQDGSVNFNRTWADYEQGFGNLKGEYWLGLEHMYQITNHRHYRLQIDYRFWSGGNSHTVDYNQFRVGPKRFKYILSLGGYAACTSGWNGLGHSNGKRFTTFDQDNDYSSAHNCAKTRGGGFWFYNCNYHGNPTGLWQKECKHYECMEWSKNVPTRMIAMKIAPNL